MAITTIGTNGIADNVITGAKVALASQAAGDVMYYNGTDWIRVAIGTDGQVLTVNNAENAPGWEAASGGIASVAADTSPQLGGSLDAQNNTILNVGNANSDWTAGTLSIATSGGVFLNMDTYSTTANEASNINLRRSKNATLGSFSQVVANDSMGTINFQGSTSSGFTGGPTISGISTESRTSSAGGSKLEIKTIANSSTTPVLAMTIDQNAEVTVKENTSMPSVTKGIAKAWGFVSATGTLNAAHYNIDTVTVNGTGDWTFNFDVDMSDDAYIAVGGARSNNDLVFGFIYAAGSIQLKCRDNTGGASVNQAAGLVVYGESA